MILCFLRFFLRLVSLQYHLDHGLLNVAPQPAFFGGEMAKSIMADIQTHEAINENTNGSRKQCHPSHCALCNYGE